MQTSEFDLSSDCFTLDRNQDEYLKLPQAQSTPTIKLSTHNSSHPTETHDLYEIIKTGEEHLVLHHDIAPATILSTANEEGPTIRRLIRDNPVIQDGIDISPPRNYHEMDSWLFATDNGTVNPISSHSSSIGYFSGSDWTTDLVLIRLFGTIRFPTAYFIAVQVDFPTSSHTGRPSRKPGTVATPETPEVSRNTNNKRNP